MSQSEKTQDTAEVQPLMIALRCDDSISTQFRKTLECCAESLYKKMKIPVVVMPKGIDIEVIVTPKP